MSNEQVLCIPRSRFDEVGSFQGAKAATEAEVSQLLAPPNPLFLARSVCEEDPSFKQLIPYLLIQWQGKLLRYERSSKGGEARLHAKTSLGIGGHVNDADGADASTQAEEIFALGRQRELDEELDFGSAEPALQVLGLINDDSDSVGAVHLGVVYLASFPDEAKIQASEEAIAGMEFLTPAELIAQQSQNPTLESWSVLAFQLYEQFVEGALRATHYKERV